MYASAVSKVVKVVVPSGAASVESTVRVIAAAWARWVSPRVGAGGFLPRRRKAIKARG